jgi:predicted GH43/DUF377 family glycosyl hydrolase
MNRHGIIVTPTEKMGATFNPAATCHHDGRFLLLVRSVPKGYKKIGAVNQFDDAYSSQLSLWEGNSPVTFVLVNLEALMPGKDFDRFGIEDPRITQIGDTYYICYTALAIGLAQENADDGIRIAMASTKDFKIFKKHGVIGPDRRSKAGALFKSAGKLYFMWKDEASAERTMISPAPDDFESPEAWKKLWASRSIEKDKIIVAQNNGYEDRGVEPGAPPIEINEGLLVVYSSISYDYKWTISVMLLDKNDPSKILAKTEAPLLKPKKAYELKGDVNNVVFPCGALIDKLRLYVYYGAADTVCAVASENMTKIMKSLKPFQNNPVLRNAA